MAPSATSWSIWSRRSTIWRTSATAATHRTTFRSTSILSIRASNTKYYHADEQGRLIQGGLFTLDGVHPSAIAHGLLAYEFLKVMLRAGIVEDLELPWPTIFQNDLLYSNPIPIMQEIRNKEWLATLVVNFIQLLERVRGPG